MPDIASLVPDGLSQLWFVTLIALSFFTSMLTAAVGIGGGTILIAALAQALPAAAIIPIHGIVQLGSNTGRALIMLKYVLREYLLYFLVGSAVGALIGGNLVVSLPADVLRLILGGFILLTVWVGNLVPKQAFSKKGFAIGGCITTILTMFVGATGPLIVAMARQLGASPEKMVATTSACLVIQHTLKIAAFGMLGFVFTPYIPMIIAMIVTGFLGTLIGKRILMRTPPKRFEHVLNILITILALRLIYVALTNLAG
jgi:uncharacterized membrane protein YfcA